MKNFLLLSVTLLICTISFGQVGVGTVAPRAAFEVSNTSNGGVLIPSYALSGNNDATTVVNPQGLPLIEGTLVYNTTTVTGTNALEAGFVYWNGSVWAELGAGTTTTSDTGVMLRTFGSAVGGVGGVGSTFNFATESFNSIVGSSYVFDQIFLPAGTYIVESNLRLNSNNSVDWAILLNNTEIAGSVRGSTNPARTNTNASEVHQVAMFELATTGFLTFEITGGTGASVLPNQCYVKIQKVE